MLTLAPSQLQDHATDMTEVFVIRNQLGHYWGKSRTWVDGSLPRQVLRTPHRDEAVNTLFELSSKDFELRGEVFAANLNERGEPVIESSPNPLPDDPAAAVVDTDSPDAVASDGDETARAALTPTEPTT
jgi:hypothetical protein